MQIGQMNFVDALIVLSAAWPARNGWRAGFLGGGLPILGALAGLGVAAAAWFDLWQPLEQLPPVGVALAPVAGWLVGRILAYGWRQVAGDTVLGLADRLLGAVFGVLRGLLAGLVVGLILLHLAPSGSGLQRSIEESWLVSQCMPLVEAATEWLRTRLPSW